MCGTSCIETGPPPDHILSMPPPPLPNYLLPRSALIALDNPITNHTPCFAAFMCDISGGSASGSAVLGDSLGDRLTDQKIGDFKGSHGIRSVIAVATLGDGVDYIDLRGHVSKESSINISESISPVMFLTCGLGVLIIGTCLLFLFFKLWKSTSMSCVRVQNKHPNMDVLCETSFPDTKYLSHLNTTAAEHTKNEQLVIRYSSSVNPYFMKDSSHSGIESCSSSSIYNDLNYSRRQFIRQNKMASENRLLWATLTPHGGTRAFVSTAGEMHLPINDGHYEVMNLGEPQNTENQDAKKQNTNTTNFIRNARIKSFDNNGFVDYEYEDIAYHSDIDSGYQEPNEIHSNNDVITGGTD